jgi:Zinc knuckle
MLYNKLTYQDTCRHAEDAYRTLYDRKEWPPARNIRDSKAPPTSFGNLAIDCETPRARSEVLTLIQTQSHSSRNSGSKPGNCHKCGKGGHWANECPDKSNSSERVNHRCGGRPSHQPRPGRGSNRRSNDSSGAPSWRTTPPPSDSLTTKTHNGKTFNWCAKCHRWTTTHTTSTHTGQKPQPPSARLAFTLPSPCCSSHCTRTRPICLVDDGC